MDYQFNFSVLLDYRWMMAESIWVTVQISFAAIALGTSIGVLIGSIRHYASNHILAWPAWAMATGYVYLFLSIPALVFILWLYYCLPLFGIDISAFSTAILALGLNLSPFAAEIFRSGLANIPKGELHAAQAIGYTRIQTLFLFMVPQIFRNSVPPMMNQYYTTVKLSSLASVIGVFEIVNTSQEIINQTYKTLEVYTAVALCYAIIIVPMALLGKYYEKKVIIARV
jgi:polar amino acid transport system permease protein